MKRPRLHRILGLALVATLDTACSHDLQIRNLSQYTTPVKLYGTDARPNIAVLPYAGTQDGLFYFNAVVERLNASRGIGEVRTDYIASKQGSYQPDLILQVIPQVDYRSSGWNFLINWPGFLIFTPAWNGYIYRADILTQVAISDRDGRDLGTTSIPISYNIRHAELDRTIFTGLTWFEVSLLAFGGGIYNANVFDRDLIGGLQAQIKDNYASYVGNQIQPKILAAADALGVSRGSPATVSPPEQTTSEPSEEPE